MCLGQADRRQALRLRRTAVRLRGLTATRLAESSALVPSMTRSVRRHSRAASVLAAADLGGGQEAKELAAGCIEGALLGFGLAMGEQRPAIIADEVADDLLDRPPAETAVHLQSADDLAAEHQMLSRCRRKVLRDRDRASSSRRNGLKHSTICRPGRMSPAS